MGPKDDELREAQRTLPRLYSNLRIMSTIGIVSPATGRGMCHYDLDGYAQMARLMSPLVERDNHGLVPHQEITAPNLRRAWFTGPEKHEISLDFGQPMPWKDEMKRYIYLDGIAESIRTGDASGDIVTLQLAKPSAARTITYRTGREWDGTPKHLIRGANGIAALTFCDVEIASSATVDPRPIHFEPKVESLQQCEAPEPSEDAKIGIYLHGGPRSVPGADFGRAVQPAMRSGCAGSEEKTTESAPRPGRSLGVGGAG